MKIQRPTGKITTKKLMELVEWQEFKCGLTGRELKPESTSLDHITAVSKGGQHLMENVQAVDRDANAAKRTLSVEEFVQLCREVVLWSDRGQSEQLKITG